MTTALRTPNRRKPRDHSDSPDTSAAFRQLAHQPAGPARDRLQEQLVRSWLPMAMRLAHKYRNRGEDTEDLEQVAALGLTKAVQRYDPARGHAFESYAVPVITGEIKKHFRDHTWDLHVPRRVQELRNRVRQAITELEPTTPSGHPSVEHIAARLGISDEDVRLGLGAMRSYSTLSLDAQPSGPDDDPRTLLDTLGEADRSYEHVIRRAAVAPYLRELPDRDRRVLYLRFYQGLSQGRIAEELGISQMQVSRILSGTCDRIRRQVDAQGNAGHNPEHTPRAHTEAANSSATHKASTAQHADRAQPAPSSRSERAAQGRPNGRAPHAPAAGRRAPSSRVTAGAGTHHASSSSPPGEERSASAGHRPAHAVRPARPARTVRAHRDRSARPLARSPSPPRRHCAQRWVKPRRQRLAALGRDESVPSAAPPLAPRPTARPGSSYSRLRSGTRLRSRAPPERQRRARFN